MMRVLLSLLLWAFLFSTASLSQPPAKGYLFLAGGKEIPPEIFEDMRKLSGKESPKLVIIPTADGNFWHNTEECIGESLELIERWKLRGFSEVVILHTSERDKVDDDFAQPLLITDCVWITGGDQNRLAHVYKNTAVEFALIDLLKRGGVIGGISAGSAILSQTMIAGGKDEPIMGEGFNILTTCVVDTHYVERSRFTRLNKAVKSHAHLKVGLGISERSAICINLSNYPESIKHYGVTQTDLIYNHED